MKIIQVTPAYKPAFIYGGPTMSVAQLCEALNETKKVAIEVLTTTANGAYELPVATNSTTTVDGVNVTYFKRITKDHTHLSPALLFSLIKSIKKQPNNQPLVIHIHAWWNLVSMLSCFIAKHYKIPVILSPRGMVTNYTQQNRNQFIKSFLHHFLGKKLLNYCHIHTTSEKEKQDVLTITQPKSITNIANLVNFPKLDKNLQPPQTPVYQLLFLSRIEEKKGLELLFEALAKVNFQWHLTIAGSGADSYLNSLKNKAENLKIHQFITWVGQINNADKFNLLAQHQLLVLTSYNENFANVVIESLAVGTPVLISNEVGLSDYVRAKNLGWTTSLSVDEITKQLTASYNDEEKRTQIRAIGHQMISTDFNPTLLIQDYLTLYRNVRNA